MVIRHDEQPDQSFYPRIIVSLCAAACSSEDSALIRLGRESGMNAAGLNLAKPASSHGSGRGRQVDVHFRHDPKTRRLLGGLPAGWAEIRLEKC